MDYTMKNGRTYKINKATESQWDDAMELAFRVFLKYEAPEYGREGTDKFAEFVTNTSLRNLFRAGLYVLYVATMDEEIVGIISYRNGNHISLLFVDDKYHRQSIGSELIRTIQDDLLRAGEYEKMTVNASPYGVPFYEKVGFRAVDSQKKEDGIVYTPMEMFL